MREIDVSQITAQIEDLYAIINYELPKDVLDAFKRELDTDKRLIVARFFDHLVNHAARCYYGSEPICSDCGTPVLFADIGCDVHINGNFADAVNKGIDRATNYAQLAYNMTSDPIARQPLSTNAPADIHIRIVDGNEIRLRMLAKGGRCESCNSVELLKSDANITEIEDVIIKAIKRAGIKGCPPYTIGVGLGGTVDKAAVAAKEALFRPIGEPNPDEKLALLENKLLQKANELDVGPQGLGGRTVLALNIISMPTHEAVFPIALDFNCHALRRGERKL